MGRMTSHILWKIKNTSWWYTYPSEKYEFVSWDDDIPNRWKNKIHVPSHQPDYVDTSYRTTLRHN